MSLDDLKSLVELARNVVTARNVATLELQKRFVELKASLSKIDGVVGVGKGGSPSRPRVIVMLATDEKHIREEIARRVHDIPYEIQVTGKFKILQT